MNLTPLYLDMHVSFRIKGDVARIDEVKKMIDGLTLPEGCTKLPFESFKAFGGSSRSKGEGVVINFTDNTNGSIMIYRVGENVNNVNPELVDACTTQAWVQVKLPRDKVAMLAKTLHPFSKVVTGKHCLHEDDVFVERFVAETMDAFFELNPILANHREKFPPIQWWQDFDEYLKWVLEHNLAIDTLEMIRIVYTELVDDHAAAYAIADRVYFHPHTVRGLTHDALHAIEEKFNNLDESYRKELLSPIDTIVRAKLRLKRHIGQRKV